MSLKIKAAVLTHVGNVRTNNEDNFFLNKRIRRCVSRKKASCRFSGQDEAILFAVADGMGGHAHGELASLHAVQSLRSCSFAQITSVATACLRWANEQICEEIEKSGNRMGSTLTALYIDEGQAVCCNIGDSRCYLLRGGTLTQLSRDDSKARRMVDLGILTPEQAARHPSRHELTQHLGIFPDELVIQPAFTEPVQLRPGDVFLLCSDGLTDMADDKAIAAVLAGGGSPSQQAKALVRLALKEGGRDNVTALVAVVQPFGRRKPF